MSVKDIEIWSLLAGLGLFLFGMSMLEDALKVLAGRTFKLFLRKHTNHPLKAVISGSLATAILQSSSMVSLLIMSFAGAGIIGLKNGIGILLGANLGTTATGWIVSLIGFKLDIEKLILPFFAIGGLGYIFFKSEKLSAVCKLIIGFSIMFLGLNYMKTGFAESAQQIDFSFLQEKPSILYLFTGFILAAAIQSSSASMMIFLSSLAAGVITLHHALYLVIGADLGTTVTALIGTINGNVIRKKIGWSQFFINVIGVILAVSLINVILYFTESVLDISDPLVILVAFHSTFNLINIIALLPFINLFTKFIDNIIKTKDDNVSKYINVSTPNEPESAIEALEEETIHFLKNVLDANKSFFSESPETNKRNTTEWYIHLKKHEKEITSFYLQLQQLPLNGYQVNSINNFIASIRSGALSAKDIKDIKHNISELSNTTEEKLFQFNRELIKYQLTIYEEFKILLEDPRTITLEETEKIRSKFKDYYHKETENIYKLYSINHNTEIEISSLLNMIREINNSNESLTRSINHFIQNLNFRNETA